MQYSRKLYMVNKAVICILTALWSEDSMVLENGHLLKMLLSH